MKKLLIFLLPLFLLSCSSSTKKDCEDNDGDGYGVGPDCLGPDCVDIDPDTNPGADEIPYDGLDNDCDPSTLDDDLDQDGENADLDCDDNDPEVNTQAEESLSAHNCHDGVDNDCDGLTDLDEEVDCPLDCVDDADHDDYVDVACGGADCDDSNPDINPGVEEIQCNQIDDDCDPETADNPNPSDYDQDGFDAGCDGDCNDQNAYIRPEAPENCIDGIDNNCDGQTDFGDVAACMSGCPDLDGDGYPGAPCGPDCDDSSYLVMPNWVELPDDGLDNDCKDGDLTRSDENGIFVSRNGDDQNPGTMAEPLQTITEAVSQAHRGGKYVYVSTGVYSENPAVTSHLIGGYSAADWTRDIQANSTVIRLYNDNLVVNNAAVDGIEAYWGNQWTHSTVEISTWATLVRSYFYRTAESPSRAVQLWSGHAIVVACDLDSGPINNSYGIVATGGAHLVAIGNRIWTRSPDVGTAVSIHSGHSALVNNHISSGVGSRATAVRIYGPSTSLFFNNQIMTEPAAREIHDGIEVHAEAQVLLVNNYIVGGTGGWSGTPLSLNDDADVTAVNNIIIAGEEASGCISVPPTTDHRLTLVSNDIHHEGSADLIYISGGTNVPTIEEINTCTWPGCTEATANIDEDPQIQSPHDDLHLTADSPCINAGTDPSPYGVELLSDYDMQPRPSDSSWDIGPDEYTP